MPEKGGDDKANWRHWRLIAKKSGLASSFGSCSANFVVVFSKYTQLIEIHPKLIVKDTRGRWGELVAQRESMKVPYR